MKPSELLSAARARGQTTLSEDDSRKVLEAYGLPLVPSRRVGSLDEAQAAARELGFPVALKGTGARLAHKTEADVVRLSLRDAAELEAAYRHVQQKGGELLEGMLVQRMLRSEREFVAGLSRDPQFGPCVMFGLGGIFTEVLQDVSFRVAPITEMDAQEMIDEIRTNDILGEFRGSPAVNRSILAKALVGVGNLGVEMDDIAEIDINPLIVSDDRPIAVDALVILKQAGSGK